MALLTSAVLNSNPHPAIDMYKMHATAYILTGKTASGEETRHGICATGRREWLGKTVELYQRTPDGIGEYIGTYECLDTGCKRNVIDVWCDGMEEAQAFINPEREVNDPAEAIAGACDIIAEIISDDADTRKNLREFIEKTAEIQTTLKEGENFKTYTMYDNYKEKVATIPRHRTLAINRGESDKCLVVKIVANEEKCLQIIAKDFIKGESIYTELMKSTIQDSFERLIMPSLDTEIRNKLTDTANEQAIKMFEVNLKPLLMQPPLKDKVIEFCDIDVAKEYLEGK